MCSRSVRFGSETASRRWRKVPVRPHLYTPNRLEGVFSETRMQPVASLFGRTGAKGLVTLRGSELPSRSLLGNRASGVRGSRKPGLLFENTFLVPGT